MNTVICTGVMLTRVDYQEADRILRVMTDTRGKVSLIAKGARRQKSKLAGGIELFSISQLSYIPGKRDIGTLISSRLMTHFGNIVKDIERTMFGYQVLKSINKVTEDAAGSEYFELIQATLQGLDDDSILLITVRLWFQMQLLKLLGHSPNLSTDNTNSPLEVRGKYQFDQEAMLFIPHTSGTFTANHIKLLRVALRATTPAVVSRVTVPEQELTLAETLSAAMLQNYVRV